MNRRVMRLLRPWVALMSLAALFVPYGMGEATPPEPPALVRIDLASEAELAGLAALGLEVYARLYTQDGGISVLLEAGKSQQEDLARQGYSLRVLDPGAQGANYYLLHGLPQDLRQASDSVDILWLEGRQAVARATPEQAERLAPLGVESLPLHLQPLIAPAPVEKSALPASIIPSPLVQAMLSQVSSSALYTQVGNLSGEWAVNVEGSPYTIATRYTYSDTPIKKATRYAYDYFQSLGLPSGYDYYSIGRNVIAEQTGLTQPGRIILLTAHLDSYAGSYSQSLIRAPGADDNASGSAALMHIAEILSQYNFNCTLRYALFTGEEQGMIGSRAYAADVRAAGENVEAVLNLDMLAYNTPDTGATLELHTRPGNASDLAIANLFAEVVSTYQISLTPLILQDGKRFSDHSSFWDQGYPAILAIEDWRDYTPYYHTDNDRLGTLNLAYYTQFVKAALATFAHMSCLPEGQLSGEVRDAVTEGLIAGASVEAKFNGQTVASTSTGVDGRYDFHLHPGNYTIAFSALDYLGESVGDVQIVHGQTTTLDVLLQPCVWIKNLNFTFSPSRPQVDETVVFSATVGAGETPISYSWEFGDGQGDSGQVVSHAYSAQGAYPVSLASNNACGVPATSASLVPVDVELLYLPLISSRIQN